MKNLLIRSAVATAAFAPAISAFAIADTDGMIPTLDYIALGANVTSIFGQVMPIGLLVAGVAVGLGAVVWVVSLLKSTFTKRTAK